DALAEGDFRMPHQVTPYGGLEERSGKGTKLETQRLARRPARAIENSELAALIEEMASLVLKIGGDPREDLLGDHQAAFEEEVEMPGLGYSRPVFTALGQLVSFDDGDAVEVIGEHASCQHAADAAAHHHGMTAVGRAFLPLLPPATVLHDRVPL